MMVGRGAVKIWQFHSELTHLHYFHNGDYDISVISCTILLTSPVREIRGRRFIRGLLRLVSSGVKTGKCITKKKFMAPQTGLKIFVAPQMGPKNIAAPQTGLKNFVAPQIRPGLGGQL